MNEKDIDLILNKRAKETMIQWSLKGFKKVFPRLYKAFQYSMDDAYTLGRIEERKLLLKIKSDL